MDIVLGIISNVDIIKSVCGRMCIGSTQILQHFIQRT
jgi:hypothetical protein